MTPSRSIGLGEKLGMELELRSEALSRYWLIARLIFNAEGAKANAEGAKGRIQNPGRLPGTG